MDTTIIIIIILFVVNRINEFTFTLLNEERKHKISTNQNAPFGHTHKSYDAISENQPAQNKLNAFCHFSNHKQSHSNSFSNPIFLRQNSSYNINSSSNSNNINSFPNSKNITISSTHKFFNIQTTNSPIKINVVTRNKPYINTFD